MKILYSKDAAKALTRMLANEARRIIGKIEQYAADPASQRNNVMRMQGRTEYHRLRVGDWRVVFVPGKELMTIAAIGPRGGIYDR
jgi:mRNA interferase RelE/StbE